MEIRIFETAEQAAQATAMLVAAQVIKKPDSVLGLPTGSTPVPIYRELVQMYQKGLVSFAEVTSFNLDEYCRLPEEHECSYHYFMKEQLFDHVDIAADSAHVPNGNAADLAAEGQAYDAAIEKAGGIDLQLLGIGQNGHIGFNEPVDEFVYGTHVVDLTPSTVEANKQYFSSEAEMPKQAISVGIGGIMSAKQIVLLATGAGKVDAIRKSIREEVVPSMPASILRMHPNVIFMLDKAAAAGL